MASWCKVVWIQTSTYRFDMHIRRTSPLQFESTGTNIEEVFIYSLHPSKLRRCWLRCLVRDPLGMLKRFCSGGFGSILIEISSLLRVSTNQKQSRLAFSGIFFGCNRIITHWDNWWFLDISTNQVVETETEMDSRSNRKARLQSDLQTMFRESIRFRSRAISLCIYSTMPRHSTFCAEKTMSSVTVCNFAKALIPISMVNHKHTATHWVHRRVCSLISWFNSLPFCRVRTAGTLWSTSILPN